MAVEVPRRGMDEMSAVYQEKGDILYLPDDEQLG